MTRNEMKMKLAEMVIKAKTVEALELVQKKMEMLGFTDLVFEETSEETSGKVADSEKRQELYMEGKSEDVSNIELAEPLSKDVKAEVPHRTIIKHETENKVSEKTEETVVGQRIINRVVEETKNTEVPHETANTETENKRCENVSEKPAPHRIIIRGDEPKATEKKEEPHVEPKDEKPAANECFTWLNPDGGELTWDDIIHRMIFDTEDDAKSACAQVGKDYLDYEWIQNPETKQYFTSGKLATK